MAQSVKRSMSAQLVISRFVSLSSVSGSPLSAQSTQKKEVKEIKLKDKKQTESTFLNYAFFLEQFKLSQKN